MGGAQLPDPAHEPLPRLASEVGETVIVAIPGGRGALCLDAGPGAFRVRAQADPGLRVPAHCTAIEECLLARLDPEETRRRVGAGPYPPMTQATVRRWSDLAPVLDTARSCGYAISRDEYEHGLLACAVAVHAAVAMVALNMVASAERVSREALTDILIPDLQATTLTTERVDARGSSHAPGWTSGKSPASPRIRRTRPSARSAGRRWGAGQRHNGPAPSQTEVGM